jgi:hypothetical protein
MADEQTAAEQRAEVDLDAERVVPGGYMESENHVPNPFFQYGNLETTDLGSTPSAQMAAISPVFAQARAANLEQAARALDPNDPTPSNLVVLPESVVTVQGSVRTADDAKDEIYGELRRLAEEPIVLGQSPAAAEAAEGVAPEDAGAELDDTATERKQTAASGSSAPSADTTASATTKSGSTAISSRTAASKSTSK